MKKNELQSLKKLLIVEDDYVLALSLSNQLENLGFSVCAQASCISEALEAIEEHKPDIVLLDIKLNNDENGIEIAVWLRENREIPYVFLSAYSTEDILDEALATAPYGYIVKPAKALDIKTTLDTALVRHKIEKQAAAAGKTLDISPEITDFSSWKTDQETYYVEIYSVESLLNHVGKTCIISKDNFFSLFPSHEQSTINEKLLSGEQFSHNTHIRDKTSNNRVVTLDICIVGQNEDRLLIAIGPVDDTSRKINQMEVFDNSDNSDNALELINESIIKLDSNFRVLSTNNYFCALFNYSKNDIIGKKLETLICQDRRNTENTFIVEECKIDTRYQITIFNSSGKAIPVLFFLRKSSSSETYDYIAIITDITKLKENQTKLNKLAFTDQLTGLGNRSLFYTFFDKFKGEPRENELLSCVFIDLDSFKLINDNYGHAVGDQVLKIIALRLKSVVRETDFIARLGGDEFVIILLNPPGEESIRDLVNKVIDMIRLPIHLAETAFKITSSIGITKQDGENIDVETLLKEADIAMYHAKSQGKDQLAFYHPALSEISSSRLLIEQGLRSALQSHRFLAHFQPIINLDNEIVAFEVLARWFHPTKGWISPDEFIPVAEQTGMIHRLGLKMFREGCIALKTIEERFAIKSQAHVNVSVHQLRKPSFLSQLLSILEEYRLPSSRLVLEITESCMDIPNDLSKILQLKAAGFQIAIDDFGVGYSSLAKIQEYPSDIIKLDKSFVQNCIKNPRQALVLKSISGLCRSLGYTVLAEGTEEEAQVALARKSGCQLFQGFYYSHPIDLQHFHQSFRHTGTMNYK